MFAEDVSGMEWQPAVVESGQPMLRLIGRIVGFVLLGSLVVFAQSGTAKTAGAAKARHRKVAKPPAVKTLPPPAAIPPMTPEQLPAEPPRVSYRGGLLSVDSNNATLGDIFSAIRQQTGAQIETLPAANSERVAAHLSGPAREVISSLLDGSKFGYIIMGSPSDPGSVQKVILTALASGGTTPVQTAGNRAKPGSPAPRPALPQPAYSPDEDENEAMTDRNPPPPPEPPPAPPAPAQPGQANPYTGGEQPRFGQPVQLPLNVNPNQSAPFPAYPNSNQPNSNPNQPTVRTPEQYLQELQRLRQQQMQQQQQQQNQNPQQ